ncbi:hypothetical protein [Microbacterium sp. Au-Mic1]|uniref:hypothetical protein n=1 Tax=Microbacterium sp. Au-Mic1 TaxID=2906457 RepID=UPI001E47ED55|nr:hypothetical protein [Microbacterium sp. Au-Mic1]
MRELYGRLADLDPTARDNLLVIEYFDRLSAARPSAEMLLKEAAILARATVGYDNGSRRYRRSPSGDAAAISSRPESATAVSVPGGGEAWLSPSNDSPPTTDMVLERLALALELIANRPGDDPEPTSTQILLARPRPDEPPDLRTRALGRLRLEADGRFRAIALPLSATPPSAAPHALMETSWGPVRAAIVRDGHRAVGPAGVGTLTTGKELHHSWTDAVIALRLAGNDESLNADDLGPVLLRTLEDVQTSPSSLDSEMLALERALASKWTIGELRAVADGHSLRAIANIRGLHHSTVHARLLGLPEILGYDPQGGLGRHRLATALMVWQVRAPMAPEGRPRLHKEPADDW